MIHTKKRIYKPISELNKNAPAGFKFIQYRILPDKLKFQVISNKISQMEKAGFTDICTLLNFTLDDIHKEKQQLKEYLNSLTLKLKMKKKPANIRKKSNKINQKEIDALSLKVSLFTKDLDKEYNRVFPLILKMIKKAHNIKEISKILSKNNKIIINLQTILEKDLRSLNDKRKELALEDIEETVPVLSQERQFTIKKLITYILNYVHEIYTPIIQKHITATNNANSRLERFCFNVIDKINKRIEKIKNKSLLDFKEFYFDDSLELRMIVKNKPPYKYPLKVLHFNDLETIQKKKIIQILKAEVFSQC